MSALNMMAKRLVAAFLACAALFGAASAADLLGVRFGPGADATRIVFDIDGAPQYQLSGEDAGAGRLIVDFTSLSVAKAESAAVAGKGHVARYAVSPLAGGGARATFDFSRSARIKEAFVLEPSAGVAKHRLVIDLETADKAAFLASLPKPAYGDLTAVIAEATAPTVGERPAATVQTAEAPAKAAGDELAIPPAPSQKTAAADAPAEKIVVVIDAGHGGKDPGAQGQSGTLEKTVTYAAASLLADILKERGRYEVVMTRSGDTTIRPDARETLAREAGADLFISLHADAIAEKAVRGASVYTLSEEGTARSANLVKSEGNYHAYDLDLKQFDSVVGDILLDKAQDTTLTESSRFAQLLVNNLTNKTPMLNRSHRKADLRVLLAADVPAVLLEMAFISNAKDEANLNSAVWRKRAMTAVADSIDQYFAGVGDVRHASLRASAAK
ncbi:MAG: N-acetylmuramoyl-L-alanine amidase [Parvularculaceae bacterium]